MIKVGNDEYRRPLYALSVLFVAWIFAYLDRQILGLMASEIKADLVLSDIQISLLQGLSFSVFFGVAGLFAGRLVDSKNRRTIIVIGIFVWSLMTLASGLVTSFEGLLIARMGVGIGEACLAPGSVSLVGDIFGPERRGRMMGVLLAGANIGAALSVLVSGFILQLVGNDMVLVPLLGPTSGWQLTFLIIGGAGLPMALWMATVREPQRRDAGAGRATDTVFDDRFGRYLATYWFLFTLILASFAFKFMTAYGGSAWLPTAFRRVYGIEPGKLGLIVGCMTLVTGLVGGIAGGALSDRFAERDPANGRLRLFQLWFFAQFAIFAVIIVTPGLVGSMIAYGLFLLAIALNAASTYTILSELVPAQFRGRMTALMLLVANVVGLGGGPLFIALLTDRVFEDEQMLFKSIAIMAMVCSICGWFTMHLAIKGAAALRQLRIREEA
ncbi:MAG: MFS transporter [Sphingomonas sp.]|uniref:MFS transporter n=1 Tax=Sphingomonas sp. TaxID=28214 RepID=UPI00261806D4|nr:MFS transporter [Sphingomonas sp.]MDK2766083.1 MFS transporter [Sphingomonas sp.]